MNKFIFILFVFISITLRESFSQCLLFNEFKSQSDFNNYACAKQYGDYFYFVGDAIDDTDELAPKGKYISKCVVVKTDRCGNILWRKFLGMDNAYESGCYIEKIGDYLYINGGTQEGARASTDFIAKLDEDGNTIWYKIYRKKNCDVTCIRMFNQNNNLVIYGSREITDIQGHVRGVIMYIYSIDANGKLIWDKEYLNNYPSNYLHTLSLTNDGYMGIVGISYTNNVNNTIEGVLICKFDTFYNLKYIDTLKIGYYTGVNTSVYNPITKKTAIHLTHWVSTDSVFCQIALLDSTGKVEKIIDDPQNFTPSCLIAYKDGWVRNYTTSLIQYDANYKVVRKFITNFGSENCYFESSHLSVVDNGRALLLAGKGRACNPYDYNPNSPYNRPTAFMVDTNFIDYGMAQPAPVKYNAIKAFPNPATESITLQITETEAEYTVYNSEGMFVISGKMQSSTEIPLGNLAGGIYFIHIKSLQGDNIGSVKFVKK